MMPSARGAILSLSLIHIYAQTPMIPRVGLRMQLPARITSLTYYGRGPEENYRDRRTSQFIGEYTSGIQDMYEPYVRPQENNHRTDIYWCTLTSKAKEGLLFVADRTFEMNVSNYPLESLDSGESIENGSPRTEKTNHRHLTDPQPEPSVDLFIDYRMMGVEMCIRDSRCSGQPKRLISIRSLSV